MSAPHDRPALPARAPHERGEQGVVLFLVLVLLATTIGSVYAFARVSILGISSAKQRMNRTRAELLARSGIDIAIQALRDDAASEDPLRAGLDSAEDAWAVLTREPWVDEAAGIELRFRIRDAGQRLDLNALVDDQGAARPESREFLRDALVQVIDAMPGRDEEKRYEPEELADAILDWIDSDEQTRLGGDEAEFYRERRADRVPLNRPLLTLAELEGIPDLDEALLLALDAYFAPSLGAPRSGGRGGVNLNTAPPHVLAMIYIGAGTNDTRFIGEDAVFQVLRRRRDELIFCPPDQETLSERCLNFGQETGRSDAPFPGLSYRSEEFVIEVEARSDDARACAGAVFSRRAENEGGGILSYRLGC